MSVDIAVQLFGNGRAESSLEIHATSEGDLRPVRLTSIGGQILRPSDLVEVRFAVGGWFASVVLYNMEVMHRFTYESDPDERFTEFAWQGYVWRLRYATRENPAPLRAEASDLR